MTGGTTPTCRFRISKEENIRPEDIAAVWITFKGETSEFTKELKDCETYVDDEDRTVIETMLSQEDTFVIASEQMLIQLRVRTNDNKAYTSKIFKEPNHNVLKKGII